MGGDARLNLLLTHEGKKSFSQPWYQTLSHLLAPLGVRTFEATSGSEAVEVIEHHPIHLAVVDWRLPSISGINVLQLIHKLHQQVQIQPAPTTPANATAGAVQTSFTVQMKIEESAAPGTQQRRIEVRFDSRPAAPVTGPAVILIASPAQDPQILHEALKFNAFSVLPEPVDVNLMLETMARALRRFHQNQWPA